MERSPINVVVVDDYPVVVEGVALLVEQAPWIRVVGSARSGRAAVEMAERLHPDVMLVDLCLPDMLGSEVVSEVARVAPNTKSLIFTAYPEHTALQATRQAGAVGLVLKDANRSDLCSAVTKAAAGEQLPWSDAAEKNATPDQLARLGLTNREYDMVRHIAVGQTNKEIAEATFLAPNTVKAYVQSALAKLGARNRVEAIARAHENGLL